MTNAIPLIQTVAASAGHNLSDAEIASLMALAGAGVHLLHQLAAAWSRVGGREGFMRWVKTGKSDGLDGSDVSKK